MKTFQIKCSQRGCESQVEANGAPENCPQCNNPLLEGNAVDVTPAVEKTPAGEVESEKEQQ